MRPLATLCLAAACVLTARAPAEAHPAPFSYLDLRLSDTGLAASLTLHTLDVAHELEVGAPERLLDPAFAAAIQDRLAALILERATLDADGARIALTLRALEPIPERDGLTLHLDAAWPARPGWLALHAHLFPYDPSHQTFVNIYEDGALRLQEILSDERTELVYYTGSRQGNLAVFRRFLASGIVHIFGGPDHVLFILGLLLLGGGLWRLLGIMTAFTIAHSVTLSLAALDIVDAPARLVEPAIALSIVYVGADNLMMTPGSRDVRAWIAFVFGFVHGFGFASVLREFGLPPRALGWALFSFNAGVEVGQAVIVLVAVPLLAWVVARRPAARPLIVRAGSWIVIAAGAFWFYQRVFT